MGGIKNFSFSWPASYVAGIMHKLLEIEIRRRVVYTLSLVLQVMRKRCGIKVTSGGSSYSTSLSVSEKTENL